MFRYLRWLLLLLGLAAWGWCLWPSAQAKREAELWPHGPTMHAEVPRTLRVGREAKAKLVLTIPTNPEGTQSPFQTVTVLLVFNGVHQHPIGETRLTLPSGQATHLTWTLAADAPGRYQGALWIHRILPDGSRMAVYTTVWHPTAHAFLGLDTTQTALLGGFALGVSALLAKISTWKEKNP